MTCPARGQTTGHGPGGAPASRGAGDKSPVLPEFVGQRRFAALAHWAAEFLAGSTGHRGWHPASLGSRAVTGGKPRSGTGFSPRTGA